LISLLERQNLSIGIPKLSIIVNLPPSSIFAVKTPKKTKLPFNFISIKKIEKN
jgi:hypothetical protein